MTYSPVDAMTTTLFVPLTPTVTLPFAVTAFTFDVPLAIEVSVAMLITPVVVPKSSIQ